jgi:cell wall-associated NlpC family hydrolase
MWYSRARRGNYMEETIKAALYLAEIKVPFKKKSVDLWKGGLSCLGMVAWCLEQGGYKIPCSLVEIVEMTLPVPIAESRPGDLIVFYRARTYARTGILSPRHVGIVVEGGMVHLRGLGDPSGRFCKFLEDPSQYGELYETRRWRF